MVSFMAVLRHCVRSAVLPFVHALDFLGRAIVINAGVAEWL